MEGVLEYFKKSTGDERLKILSRIVNTLSGAEVQAVNKMISEREDPLHKLPFELVQAIFSYLPVYDAWRLQLVIRRWRETLESERFLSARMTQEEANSDRNNNSLTPVMSMRTIQHRVRHMQARRLGRPFTYCTLYDSISGSFMLTCPGRQRTALHGHHIAYVRGDVLANSNQVVLRDLRTGVVKDVCTEKDLLFMGSAREHVYCLTLTCSLLAFLTYSATLYVIRIDSPEAPPVRLRLPSINVFAFTGDGDTVAMLVRDANVETCALMVYSSRTGTLSVQDIGSQVIRSGGKTLELMPQNLLIDERLGYADIFSYDTLPTGSEVPPRWVESHFGHARFELGKTSSAQATPILSSSIGWIQERNVGSVGTIRYIGSGKLYRIEREMARTDASLMFDAERGELYVEQHSIPANAKESGCLLRWKNTFHMVETDRRAIYTLVSREQDEQRTVKHQSSLLSGESCSGDRSTTFINESYIVNFEHYGEGVNKQGCICVYCFDEDVQLADGKRTGLWADNSCSSHNVAARNGEAESPFLLWTPFEHKLPFQGSANGRGEKIKQ